LSIFVIESVENSQLREAATRRQPIFRSKSENNLTQ